MSLFLPVVLLVAVPAPPLALRGGDAGCPRAPEVTAALEARVHPQISGTAWTLAYGTEGTASAGGERTLRLELRDPAGDVRLRRTFSVSPDACVAAADALALVVERYFTGIEWTTGAPAPEPAQADAATAPRPERKARLAALAGAALVRDSAWAVRAALDLRWNAVGPLTLGAGVLLPGRSRSEALAAAGTARATAWPVRLSVLLGRPLGARFAVDAGLDGFLALESGRADNIAVPGSGERLVADVGAAAVGSWLVAGRWRVAVEAGGYRRLGPTFAVTESGGERIVLEPARWQAMIMGRLGFVLWR